MFPLIFKLLILEYIIDIEVVDMTLKVAKKFDIDQIIYIYNDYLFVKRRFPEHFETRTKKFIPYQTEKHYTIQEYLSMILIILEYRGLYPCFWFKT